MIESVWPSFTEKARDFPFFPLLLLGGFLSLAMMVVLVCLKVEDGLGIVLGGWLVLYRLLEGGAKGGGYLGTLVACRWNP